MDATPIIGRQIMRYETVTSTNDLANRYARLGEPEGLVVTAEEQTEGRGRLGRAWIVPAGTSLQLSVLLRPALNPKQIQVLAQMAGLAITAALREAYGLAPALKWPNDVLLNGKKCAGILIETGIEADQLAFAVLGIGLNLNYAMQAYPDLAPVATTLADALGHPVDRAELEHRLLTGLDAHYARVRRGEALFGEWRAQLETLGRWVHAVTPEGPEEGRAVDVLPEGTLILERKDGSTYKLVAGDVSLNPGG